MNDRIIIKDKNINYNGILNYEKTIPSLSTSSTILTPLNNRTPFIVNNIEQQYYTGNITATFVEENENTEWGYDFDNAVQYREKFKNWLLNGKPKILELPDGRNFIVIVGGDITETISDYKENVKTSFTWYEIDEYNYTNLLFKYDLLEV